MVAGTVASVRPGKMKPPVHLHQPGPENRNLCTVFPSRRGKSEPPIRLEPSTPEKTKNLIRPAQGDLWISLLNGPYIQGFSFSSDQGAP